MGSGEAWRWGLLTPQAEGATWGGGCATRGLPCRLSLGACRGLSPLWTRSLASPWCSLWGAAGGAGSPGRAPWEKPLTFYVWSLVLPVQVAKRSPQSRASTPGTPEHTCVGARTPTHTHTHTHTQVTLSVHPSTRSRSWARAGGTKGSWHASGSTVGWGLFSH